MVYSFVVFTRESLTRSLYGPFIPERRTLPAHGPTAHLRRRRVVEAARDQFWDRGYAATSVDDLTAATRLGKGSLYGAFGDKHALFVRALDDYCVDGDRSGVGAAASARASPRSTGSPTTSARSWPTSSPTPGVGCLMAKSAAELGGRDEQVDRIVGDSLRRWHTELVDCLVEAQADGTVAAQADPQALATMMLAQLRGFQVLRQGGLKPAQLAAAAEQMLALVAAD